jgi:hypothetical protein
MTSRRFLIAFAALALAAAGRARAESKFELAVATDSRDSITQHDAFPPSTAKIYVIYKVTLPKAGRVRAAWVTEKVDGYGENQKFGDSGSNMEAGSYMSAFSYGRPGAAWPLGVYRVDLYVDDKMEKSVHFKVTK